MQNADNQLIEAVFSLSRLMKGTMSFQCTVVHLSLLQIEALIYIMKNNDCQMREIAERFKIEMPTATSLINKLCIMKLTKRISDKKDRRIVRINLTEKGKQLLDEAMEERSKKIHKLLIHIPENDKKELLRIIQTVLVNLEKEYEK